MTEGESGRHRYAPLVRVPIAPALLLALLAPAVFAADSPPRPDPPEEGVEAALQADDEEAPPIDFHFRIRGRFLDEVSDPGDIALQRLSLWSDTRVGERVQIRATWDVGDDRVHDLWAQVDLGGGLKLRAGRSAPTWIPEFTDPPFAFQMVGSAQGAALTRIRETGAFLLWDRGPWNARLHLVAGNGFQPDENSNQDVLFSVGRSFPALGRSWDLDVGHYEGTDGPDDALTPVRETAVHLDGDLGDARYLRAVVFRREEEGHQHLGAFVRARKRWPNGLWGAVEVAGESNHEAGEHGDPKNLNSVKVGARYELPWVLTHIAADYRWYFGAVSDHEVLVVFQWVFDFRNPRRN